MSIIEKKVSVCDEAFKRLSDDLINAFARKFKFDRHESFEIKVRSFRVIHEVSLK